MTAPALPNLIIAGFPKCGTHALLHNLGHHPDIHRHPHEVGFFGTPDRSIDDYMALFDSRKKFNVEKTPVYALNKAAMRHMAEVIPNALILICIRHPVQAMHSFYNFRIVEHQRGFPSGIDPQKYRFEDIVLKDMAIQHLSARHYRYTEHIEENVLTFYPEHQVHFVVQERMMQNKNREMNRLFNLLGLAPHTDTFETKIKFHTDAFQYAHIDYNAPRYKDAVAKLLTMYAESNQALRTRLNDAIPEWDFFEHMYERLASR